MKKITPLFLALAICLWAADFWQSKPYTDWSDKDVQKMETNSPWAKQVPVAAEGGGGSGKSGGKGNRGGSTSELDGGPSGGLSNGGNAGRNTGIQDVGGSAMGGGAAAMTLTVTWQSALPVRQAFAKKKFGAEAATSPDAKKMIEEDPKVYAILVSGLPARAIRGNDKMKESLLQATSLIVKGKDPIQASDVQTGGNEQRAVLLFTFPKTAALTLDDKEVEFSTKLGPIVVKQKFHLKEMVFNGKLDL